MIIGKIRTPETSGDSKKQRRADGINISHIAGVTVVLNGLLCRGPWKPLPLKNSKVPAAAHRLLWFSLWRSS
jgi:hypothetical protein